MKKESKKNFCIEVLLRIIVLSVQKWSTTGVQPVPVAGGCRC